MHARGAARRTLEHPPADEDLDCLAHWATPQLELARNLPLNDAAPGSQLATGNGVRDRADDVLDSRTAFG